MQRLLILSLLCVAAAAASSAQTFTTLASFNFTDGAGPNGLVQGFDGNFYGAAFQGGANLSGTFFKVTPGGMLTAPFSFNSTDATNPDSALVQTPDGNFYGTTSQGGSTACFGFGCGTVFSITPAGVPATLHSFIETDGELPQGLVQAANGNFYGLTPAGGSNPSCLTGCGTAFKITPSGLFTTLNNFGLPDGVNPNGTLVQAYNGNLYGASASGGAHTDFGTVFRLTAGGRLTTLHSFNGTDGEDPFAGLVQANDGNLYGTTGAGAGAGCGISGCGTVFKITPDGTLTTLHTFAVADGGTSVAPLVAATDGNLYGTTIHGGASNTCVIGCGTMFKITPAGKFTTLFNFDSSTGSGSSGLIEATDGNFYGATSSGGTTGDGSIFRLSIGLGPFVKTVPIAGPVGTIVHILGTNLTTPVSVTFNGTPAAVSLVSPSQIIATVPAGATTGKVVVTLPSGTLTSNAVFQVRP